MIALLVRRRLVETLRASPRWLLLLGCGLVAIAVGLRDGRSGLALVSWPLLVGIFPIGDPKRVAAEHQYLLSRGAGRLELLLAHAFAAGLVVLLAAAALLLALAFDGRLFADPGTLRSLLLLALLFVASCLSGVLSLSLPAKGWRGRWPRLLGLVLASGLMLLPLLVQVASTGQRGRVPRAPVAEWRRLGLALGEGVTELCNRPGAGPLWLLAGLVLLLALVTLLRWKRADL